MKKLAVGVAVVVVALSAVVGVQAFAQGKHHAKTDRLSGYNETPARIARTMLSQPAAPGGIPWAAGPTTSAG